MKSFLVVGLGRFGSSVARELYKLGNEVLAIDIDEDTVQKIAPFVTHAVCTDARDESALNALGARNFHTAIVSIAGELQNSIIVTLLLKELGIQTVISKAQNKLHSVVLEKIGADRIIFPEHDMGIKVAQSLDTENVIDLIELSEDYSIVEIGTPNKWVGKSILELDIRGTYGLNILATRHGKELNVSPTPSHRINKGDMLLVIGANENIKEFTKI